MSQGLRRGFSSFRNFNFSAGPAVLPRQVKLEAVGRFFDYDGNDSNFMELSHRDSDGPVQNMIVDNEMRLRNLLKIPEDFRVFFMHGGAHAQFAAIPLNLDAEIANVKETGYWAKRAGEEMSKFVDVVNSNVNGDSDYTYLCLNETIDGIEIFDDKSIFSKRGIPVIADATSTLLSRPIDVSTYGMIFASSGKNLGPSGITTIICREDLIVERPKIPGILSWFEHANSKPTHSIYNTPSTWQIYMLNLVLRDLEKKGGISWAEERAKRLSSEVYSVIDKSDIYVNNVSKHERSRMNIPFTLRTNNEDEFLRAAEKRGIFQLQGHPLFGGLRVTLYNGIEEIGVDTLLTFMKEFNDRQFN